MRYFGSSQHTVDDKGRVSLPAKFRKELPSDLIVVPGFGKALYVFAQADFDAWVDSFFSENGYNPRSKEDRRLRTRLCGSAESVSVDGAGRVKLSAKQREKAGIVKDVIILGNDDHIEIWGPQAHEEYIDEDSPLDDFMDD